MAAKPMEAPEAIRQAQAHLQNAMELAQRPVGKEELLYMWDNQITAIDNFLADTEIVMDKVFQTWRGKLRDAKKKLTDTVMMFEAAQEGEEFEEDETPDEEWVEAYLEMAGEMTSLVGEALEEKVKAAADLIKWEEPLAVINGYLADSEPFQEMNHELRKARSIVRVARKDLKNRLHEFLDTLREEDDGKD